MNARQIRSSLIVATTSTFVCLAGDEQWPNLDSRRGNAIARIEAQAGGAAASIKLRISGLRVDFDPILETPKCVYSINRLLSDPEAISDQITTPPLPHGATPLATQPVPDKSDRYRLLKKFLNENSELFGYDANILSTARIARESVTERSGLRTVVWQQEFEGVPVFEGILIGNFTSTDALVSFSSQVVPDLPRAVRANTALILAVDALARAARSIGDEQSTAEQFSAIGEPLGVANKQAFRGEPIVGEAEASLV
ncbi:MAG TPA: hypothetical protein VFZ59_14780 [Verrucomicrobiae bacterium]|nr:hypothetical protein [Verrucomicrobiae bacterium]